VQEEKMQMFRNRLTKVFRHIGNRQAIREFAATGIYDHDLPEFPFCIENYEDKLYVAEYKRRHSMTEEQHDEWMEQCLLVMSEVLTTPKSNIFLRLRQRKAGRLGQYQKLNNAQHEFIVHENGLKFIVNLTTISIQDYFWITVLHGKGQEQCSHKKVLNLLPTRSISVYAAAGVRPRL
jgi:23S rRNA (cytosine1962-C5)-methyltransferase